MATGQRHWKTQDSQWDEHKATIRSLYCDQNKTLAEVMEIMGRKHDFHATYVPRPDPAVVAAG